MSYFQNILIFGKNGQIGSNLADILSSKVENLILAGRDDADFSTLENVKKYLKNLASKPNIIINACAYTAVDKAEEELEICDNVNHLSVKILAEYCAENKIPLIHYSTDYVYDGEGGKPFSEDDLGKLKPLSVYGKTKLAGDEAIIGSGCDHIILRTSWVYNHTGKNFVKTMIKLAMEKEELKVVSDQVGSPTYAFDIAMVTDKIISKLPTFPKFPSGVYHACPREFISWHEFACRAIEIANKEGFNIKVKNVKPIATYEYPTPAKRPNNSRLSTNKIENVFGVRFPEINESLSNAISKMGL